MKKTKCPVRAEMQKWGFTLAAEDPELNYNSKVLESWKNYPKSMNEYAFQFKYRRDENGEVISKT